MDNLFFLLLLLEVLAGLDSVGGDDVVFVDLQVIGIDDVVPDFRHVVAEPPGVSFSLVV